MDDRQPPAKAATAIEFNTIRPIPLNERHGRPRDLFTIWFGSNIMLLTVMTGSLTISIYHLSFLWANVALLVGHLVGAVFMALHAAQGPQLGVPQMVQTRGQFGSYGSVLVVALVVIMYTGFMASNMVVGSQTLHAVFPPAPTAGGILVSAVLSLVAAAFGYKLIHAYARVMCCLSGLTLLLAFVWLLWIHGLPQGLFGRYGFNRNGFLAVVSVAALWQLAYAPYVSDYSRYMPPGTSERRVFWACYSGCVIGSYLPMLLGILLALAMADSNLMTAIASMQGPVALLFTLVFSLGIAASNAINLYCCVLCALTLGQTFFPRWSPQSKTRMLVGLLLVVIEVLLALGGQANFLENYTNFILLLLYVLVPWTAINLVDYYLVAHGKYDVAAFFQRDGGIYGYYNWRAIFCYLLGIAVQIPFISSQLYHGPIAQALGGADISWIAGLVVVCPTYYWLSRGQRYLAA